MTESSKVDLLIKEGEGFTVEFKERFTSRISEDLVAFANSRGGTILLGVRDDHVVVGEKLSNALKAQIISIGRNCTPPIGISAKQIGKVIAITVSEGTEKPYSCSAGYFRRLDAVTQKMNTQELRIQFRENDAIPFEERICSAVGVEDISDGKVEAFLKESRVASTDFVLEDILQSLSVVNHGKVTNCGVLLFAKKATSFLQQCRATLVAFKGKERVVIYDRQDVEDDLLTQFNAAVSFIKKHLNRASIIKGVDREDSYEIPEEVFREAVANAIIHRDYSVYGTDFTISVFDDRIEICNPGGLVTGLSAETLGKISKRRNERIADMFHRMFKVERTGTGINRMISGMLKVGLPQPKFEYDAFFITTLHRPLKRIAAQPDGTLKTTLKTTPKTTPKNQDKIVAIISRNASVTTPELAGKLGISIWGVKKHLAQLKKNGLINRIGSDKGGHWEVVKK